MGRLFCYLAWLAIVFLDRQQIAGIVKANRFLCETAEDIRQIKNANLKRFILHKNQLYLILADKVIALRSPRLGGIEPSLTITEPVQYITPENDSTRAIGYIRAYEIPIGPGDIVEESLELYYDAAKHRIEYGKMSKLDFSSVPGRRVDVRTGRANSTVVKHETFRDLAEVPSNRAIQNYLNFKVNEKSFVLAVFTMKYSILIVSQQKEANETADDYEICFEYCLNPFSTTASEPLNCLQRLTVPVGKRKIKFIGAQLQQTDAGAYINLVSLDSHLRFLFECKNGLVTRVLSQDSLLLEKLLVRIKNLNFILLHQTAKLFDVKDGRLSFSNEQKSPLIGLDELLACPTTGYIVERQVKGIYYDREFKTFFLFIRRSIYSIPSDKENLIAKNFTKDLVAPHLKSPKLLDLNVWSNRTAEYELVATSWVKNLRHSSYLVPTPSEQNVFKLNPRLLTSKAKFEKPKGINYIGLCKGQTLQVEFSVFCFDERHYYKLSEVSSLEEAGSVRSDDQPTKFEIAKIFSETALSPYYTEVQRLKFIFNYGDHQFVLMTVTNLFVFDYANLSCEFDVVECGRIVTKFDPGERGADLYENHLFDNQVNETVDFPDQTNDPRKSADKQNYTNLFIVISLFLAFLVISGLMMIKNQGPLRKKGARKKIKPNVPAKKQSRYPSVLSEALPRTARMPRFVRTQK